MEVNVEFMAETDESDRIWLGKRGRWSEQRLTMCVCVCVCVCQVPTWQIPQ